MSSNDRSRKVQITGSSSKMLPSGGRNQAKAGRPGGPELSSVEEPPPVPGGGSSSRRRTNPTGEQRDQAENRLLKDASRKEKSEINLFPSEAGFNTNSSSIDRIINTSTEQDQYGKKGSKNPNSKVDVKLTHDVTAQQSNLLSASLRNSEELERQSGQQSSTASRPAAAYTGPGAYRVDQDGTDPTAPGWADAFHPNAGGPSTSVARIDPSPPSTDDYSIVPVVLVPQCNPQQEDDNMKAPFRKRKWLAIGVVVIILIIAIVGISVGLLAGSKSNKKSDLSSPTTADSSSPQDALAPSLSPTVSFQPTISGSEWIQLGENLNGLGASDEFGQWLSLSGDGRTLAIASVVVGSSPAYINTFHVKDEKWTQVGDTLFQDAASAPQLSFDGSRMIVGISQAESSPLFGRIEAFEMDSIGAWAPLGSTLFGSTTSFGFSVAISSDGMVIAVADYLMPSSISNELLGKPAGGVTVYRWSTDQEVAEWAQLGTSMCGELSEDYAYSVSLSFDGSVVAIGAVDRDGSSAGAFKRGHARVFELVGDSIWVQRGTDLEADPVHGKDFGASIDISDDGSVVAIGDPLFERSKSAKSGAASIFRYDGESWALQGDMIKGGDLDQLGWSLSLSGDGSVVILGAPRLAFPNDIGYASAFHWVHNSWVRLGEELSMGQQGENDFGYSVGISADGRTVAVADTSIFNTQTQTTFGSVRVFELV